ASNVRRDLATLNDALSDLRQNSLAMMREGSTKRLDTVREAHTRANDSVKRLGSRHPQLGRLPSDLDQYMQLAERFARDVEQQARSRTVLVSNIETSLEAINTLIARQNQLSVDES